MSDNAADKEKKETEDQRSINAERLRQLESQRAKADRASKARARGGKATPDQIEDRLSATSSDKISEKPKRDTRKEMAESRWKNKDEYVSAALSDTYKAQVAIRRGGTACRSDNVSDGQKEKPKRDTRKAAQSSISDASSDIEDPPSTKPKRSGHKKKPDKKS